MNLQRWHWATYFLFWTTAVVAAGAILGALSFPLFGPLFGSTLRPLDHALAGTKHGGFISLIWAPGIALVLSVRRAYRNHQKQQ